MYQSNVNKWRDAGEQEEEDQVKWERREKRRKYREKKKRRRKNMRTRNALPASESVSFTRWCSKYTLKREKKRKQKGQ